MKVLRIYIAFIIIFISLFTGDFVSAATSTWDFDNPLNYSASSAQKVEVNAGNGSLVNDPLPKGVGNISYTAMSTPASGHSTLSRAIAQSGDYFYISFCSSNTTISSISVIDASDPENPTSPTHINTGAKCTYDLHADGAYLYASNWQDNSVDIFDISTPASPTLINTIANDPTRALTSSQGVYAVGNTLYTTAPVDEFGIIDVTDPLNPVIQGLIVDDVTTALDYAYQIIVDGDYAYVTALADNGVEILDISDPLNPTHVGAIFDDGVTSLSTPYEIEKSGDYVYVAALGEDAVQVIDVSDPANPTHTATIVDDGTRFLDEPYSISVVGNDLYAVSRTEDAVSRIDISDPTNPQYIGALQNSSDLLLNDLRLIKGEGDMLYTFGRSDGFQVLTTRPYHQDHPYLTPSSSIPFTRLINTFTETLGVNNQGEVSYQVSTDDGVTWYYWNGSAWVPTIQTDGSETSSASNINDYIATLDTDGGNFLWRAYFTSNGNQVVELDQINIIFDDLTPPTSPEINAAQAGDTTITGTGENGTTITLDIGTCTNSPVIVAGGVWSCDIAVLDAPDKGGTITATSTDGAGNSSTGTYQIPNPSSGGSSVKYVCKDTSATNYSKFGRHKQSKCKYEQASVSKEEKELTAENPFGGDLCPSHLIIHDNMKNGDTNGQYSSYNKGIVTEISILQAHINRLLVEEYGPQAAGPVDDYFRGLTHRGVERLQKRLNTLLEGKIKALDVDGIVGSFTRAAINRSC